MKIHIWLFNLGGQKLRDWGEKKYYFQVLKRSKVKKAVKRVAQLEMKGFLLLILRWKGKSKGGGAEWNEWRKGKMSPTDEILTVERCGNQQNFISACALFKPELYFLLGSDHLLYHGYINHTYTYIYTLYIQIMCRYTYIRDLKTCKLCVNNT